MDGPFAAHIGHEDCGIFVANESSLVAAYFWRIVQPLLFLTVVLVNVIADEGCFYYRFIRVGKSSNSLRRLRSSCQTEPVTPCLMGIHVASSSRGGWGAQEAVWS